MAKKILKKLKLQIPAGNAVPNQQLGPALGQAGINIGEFISRFNEATKDKKGEIATVEIFVHDDRTFGFTVKTPPVAGLILKAIGVEKGSGKNVLRKVGMITRAQVREIAEKKMPDLNANDIEGAMKIVEGSCRSMGVEMKG
ncbi:MAG: 50S ribosomal protein L11 [Candidatus Pacebacteria bacterium]|nr:50S ribosomal protein L11 [Candidatus Paceibacterota bacterium]